MSTFAPFAKPLYMMLKPVGSKCNLDCNYCYYLEKSSLYPNNRQQVMREEHMPVGGKLTTPYKQTALCSTTIGVRFSKR